MPINIKIEEDNIPKIFKRKNDIAKYMSFTCNLNFLPYVKI